MHFLSNINDSQGFRCVSLVKSLVPKESHPTNLIHKQKSLPKFEYRFDFFVDSGISLEVNEGMMENQWKSMEIDGNPYVLPTPWAAAKDKESIAFP